MDKQKAAIQATLSKLNFPAHTDLSDAATQTSEMIQLFVELVRKTGKVETQEAEEHAVQTVYKKFFAFADEWTTEQRVSMSADENDPAAIQLKEKAQGSATDIQASIIRFALIYMHLDRCSGIVSNALDELDMLARDKNFKWTSDTGSVLRKYLTERGEMYESYMGLKAGLERIAELEPHYKQIVKLAPLIAPKADTDKTIRVFNSALRTSDFAQARTTAEELLNSKKGLFSKPNKNDVDHYKTALNEFLKLLEAAQDSLRDEEDKLIYKSSELGMLMASLKVEIETRDEAIFKYFRPYLTDKRKSFVRTKERLLVFGSLQSLTTLYMKLVRGLTRAMKDMQHIREYESEVIQHIDYILGGQFTEIDNIEKRTAEDLDDFFDNYNKFKTILDTPLDDLTTVETDNNPEEGTSS